MVRNHRFIDMIERVHTNEAESKVHIDINKLNQISIVDNQKQNASINNHSD